jgi:4-hydroxythreonine-4-phosphate dehydrogenase
MNEGSSSRPLRIALSLGDPTGIGPEVTLLALARLLPEDETRYVVVGQESWVSSLTGLMGCPGGFPVWRPGHPLPARVHLLDPGLEPGADEGPCNPVAARASLGWLEAGARACLDGELDALVTAPVHKAAIVRSGFPGFRGQTEHLAALADQSEVSMMLLGQDSAHRWLRVLLVTTHLPLAEVARAVTVGEVGRALRHADLAARQLGLSRRRIGVCGLNPHAGESGVLGDEEIRVIGPAVRSARAEGLDVVGPVAADTLFHHALSGEVDVVVAMYHDQGLAPLKMVAFDNGVNWTVGLPFVRTSPDHGTAHDLVGTGRADPSSMESAIRLARELAARRIAGRGSSHGPGMSRSRT